MKPRMAVGLFSLLVFAGCAKIVVVPVPVGDSAGVQSTVEGEGVFYALPETVIRVETNVQKTTFSEGKFAKFAVVFTAEKRVCLGDKCKEQRFWIKDAEVSSYGRPDRNQVYMVKFVGKGAVDQELSMTWNEMGVPGAINAKVTNRTADLFVSGAKLALGIGQRVAYSGTIDEIAPQGKCPEKTKNDEWVISAIRALAGDGTTLILNYCAIPPNVRSRDFKETDARQEFEAAVNAYVARVQPLLTGRRNLLEANQIFAADPAAYLNRLDIQLSKEIRDLFVGSKKTEAVWEGAVDVVLPVSPPLKPVKLIRIDPAKGVCAVADLAPTSKPIPNDIDLTVKGGNSCENQVAPSVVMNVEFHPNEKNQLHYIVNKGVTQPAGEKSFRYRIPAQVKVEVKDAMAIEHPELPGRKSGQTSVESYGSGVLSVAQLGHVAALPAKRNSKSLAYDLGFIEATGGLKSFKLGSTGGLDTAHLDTLGTATTGLLDARNKARAAAETEADELTQIQRRAAILKAQKEICDYLKALNLPCEFIEEN